MLGMVRHGFLLLHIELVVVLPTYCIFYFEGESLVRLMS
jgi:hypothetical protein